MGALGDGAAVVAPPGDAAAAAAPGCSAAAAAASAAAMSIVGSPASTAAAGLLARSCGAGSLAAPSPAPELGRPKQREPHAVDGEAPLAAPLRSADGCGERLGDAHGAAASAPALVGAGTALPKLMEPCGTPVDDGDGGAATDGAAALGECRGLAAGGGDAAPAALRSADDCGDRLAGECGAAAAALVGAGTALPKLMEPCGTPVDDGDDGAAANGAAARGERRGLPAGGRDAAAGERLAGECGAAAAAPTLVGAGTALPKLMEPCGTPMDDGDDGAAANGASARGERRGLPAGGRDAAPSAAPGAAAAAAGGGAPLRAKG
ncbi:hypothetical protein MNEG_7499 [Monoraphidium neglectum]|uniref:Uncharacterized protein n=1 Tax=Monoraphidium neglectum TaxID=145388 RepID=A0A0D2MB05_9CHLO|nr:hypothetical protein MNEG_7499 [Monoraphidium neglectum]KIZ00460.1 hypothetical protein MNEG_7499 [Monoraphidium neglectum]|eukprot:XP_013899479.1 hypothetical protein MNEG_7499 [Monoraphidium neglectum]